MSGELAREIAASRGLPDGLADRLVGETREELERDADGLRRFLDSRQPPPTAAEQVDAVIRQAAGHDLPAPVTAAQIDGLIRRAAGHGPPTPAAEEPPPASFDGGARGGVLYEPPSMDSVIRAHRDVGREERAARAEDYDRVLRQHYREGDR